MNFLFFYKISLFNIHSDNTYEKHQPKCKETYSLLGTFTDSWSTFEKIEKKPSNEKPRKLNGNNNTNTEKNVNKTQINFSSDVDLSEVNSIDCESNKYNNELELELPPASDNNRLSLIYIFAQKLHILQQKLHNFCIFLFCFCIFFLAMRVNDQDIMVKVKIHILKNQMMMMIYLIS